MATHEVRHQEETLVRINREKPSPFYESKWFGKIWADWKLPWLLFTFISSVALIVIGVAVGLWWSGWVYTGFAVLFYLTFIQVRIPRLKIPPITWLHRRGLHWYRGFMGYNWYQSLDPAIGEAFGITTGERNPPREVKALGKIRFNPHEVGGAVLGTAEDFRYHTLSGTLKVTSESLFSVDAETRSRRLAAFAHLLDTLAQSDVYRFAWQDTTLLGEHHDPNALLEGILKGSRLNRSSPPNRNVLLRWIDENNRDSVVHETTMTLSVSIPALRHEAKELGGDYGKVLERRLKDFYFSVIGRGSGHSPIGLSSAYLASYNDLVLLNLLRLDPVYAQPLWQQWARPHDADLLLNEKLAWPDSSDFRSEEMCRLGETYHLGFYIEEFGEAGWVRDSFWELVGVPVPKTVSVVFQMLPRDKARKTVERYASAVKGVNIDRASEGMRVTQFHEEDERQANALESELARNMGHVGRVRCYIDVTGESPEQAQAYARLLRSAVTTNTPFVMRPLTTRQLRGIDALMPLTRGLRA